MKVKGTMLVNMIRLIRANKDKDWDKWLKTEDWEIVNSKVLPSQWYPYETYERIGFAVFKEIAGSNLETVRIFGKFMAQEMGKVYTNIRVEGDPAASILKLGTIRETFMKDVESEIKVIDNGPNHLKFRMTSTTLDSESEVADAFGYQMAGTVEEMVEMAGGKNPSVELEKVENGYEYLIKWE